MRIETVPLILAVVFGLIGAWLVYDAWAPDMVVESTRERRRRARAERHRGGEAMVGLGLIGVAGAFYGRDAWAYSNVAVIAGMVLLVIGTLLNRPLLVEMLKNRGPSRRREGTAAVGDAPGAPGKKTESGQRPKIR